jgi:hypothetical protein
VTPASAPPGGDGARPLPQMHEVCRSVILKASGPAIRWEWRILRIARAPEAAARKAAFRYSTGASAFTTADPAGILVGMPDTATTLKVPRSLGERIAARAARQRMTVAEAIAELLDDADRRSRFEAVREAYANTDAAYREETEAWDSLADEGLHR